MQGTTEKGIHQAATLRNRALCAEHFVLTLAVDHFPNAEPGQFVQVLCRSPIPQYENAKSAPLQVESVGRQDHLTDSPMLRRPFSIGGFRRDGRRVEMDLMGRVVGPGTRWLSERRAGDAIDILGPLGRAFTMPRDDEEALLVAGGIGLPPIRWLSESLAHRGITCCAVFGARSANLIPLTITQNPSQQGDMTLCVEEYSRHGILAAVTTDDGSLGMHGRVTDAMSRFIERRGAAAAELRVYACGPEPMLRAVARLCLARGLACEVAMERVMACGMGTCQSCVVPINDPSRDTGWRYALCCTEGPVFSAAAVRWD